MTPREVKIGGLSFQIYYVDGLNITEDLWGQILYKEQAIRLACVSPDRMRRSLIHEILHGIVVEYGIREIKNAEAQEIIIDQLSTGLCEALESLGLVLPTKEQE